MPANGPTGVDRLTRAMAVRFGGYRSRFVDSRVGPIHVLEREGAGTLPPVVLFHGLGSSSLQYLTTMRALRAHVRRVVACDLPGHGFSVRPDRLSLEVLHEGLLDALDAVHTEPAVVVGNSLGGAAALRYANARPEKVLGAVFLSPGGAPMTADELAELRRTFGVGSLADARAFLGRLLARTPAWRRFLIAPWVRDTLADPLLQEWLATLGDADFLAPQEVRAAPARSLLVWGRAERILPSSGLDFWRRHLPAGARVLEPDGVGHSPQFESGTEAASYVLEVARALG